MKLNQIDLARKNYMADQGLGPSGIGPKSFTDLINFMKFQRSNGAKTERIGDTFVAHTTDRNGQPVITGMIKIPGVQTSSGSSVTDLVRGQLTEQNGRPPTNTELLKGLKQFYYDKSSSSGRGAAEGQLNAYNSMVADIADAIESGKQPPEVKGFGMSKIAAPLKAELAKRGYDQAQATLDWKATERYLSSLNSTQQLRLRQAVEFAKESLPIVKELATEWDAGQFPVLNKAHLLAAKQGAYGTEAASVATRFDNQLTEMISELGTVYKGGNSSTDKSLEQAAKLLSSDWEKKVLLDNIALIDRNLKIRQNSLRAIGASGVSGKSNVPKTGEQQGEGSQAKPVNSVPTLQEFSIHFKELHPNLTDKELSDAWTRLYGGKK